MNTYILIITLMLKSGGDAGMGGVSMIEVKDYEACHRIGKLYLADLHRKHKYINKDEAIYTCTKG